MKQLFSPDGFMPHGQCYMWDWGLIWLHVVSDGLITLAYYSIPFTLVYFVRKRKDLAFDWMFVCFAVFIVACGTTHLLEVWTLWHPGYWLSGGVKALTALASVPTAVLLVKLLPAALALPSPAELERANASLQKEIAVRQAGEETIRRFNADLERRVAQRTAELAAANARLQSEIEERQRAEGAVHQLNAELEQRVAQRTAELLVANQELEAFAYSVSHDLRAPLRSVDGFSQALLEDCGAGLGEVGRQHVQRVQTASRRMGQLIDDLLNLSRVTRAELRREQVDLAVLAQAVAGELAQGAPGRRVELVSAARLPVHGDPRLLRVVLENLLGNAWKFTRNKTDARVELGTKEQEGQKVYFVRDNGAGFEMAYVNKLFGAFQRLHPMAEYEGTGIGLATVQRIIHRHGGRVWAEGSVDQGASFYFTLPA
ncbi:MAG: hypothetical protein HY298_23805 [Verrucomicrobia bacterium]|nr:hypothetical protein [Verrucomicrobiota bacterium]